MPAAAGLALSLCFSLLALGRSRQTAAGYYEREVYGMTPATHRAYAAVFACFAAAFAASFAVPAIPVTILLGGYVIVMVFYGASFARGFGE